ncbi:MAG TPA: sigma 54-interacting transcriptional regulator [Tepidisphaeraceae bacterium]|nr:sigma 54-interacting transcriptional regulator [Tepidisphaeraceae bacterium]
MGILSDSERACAVALSHLTFCNPFLPERIEYERQALGEEFVESDAVWNAPADLERERPNIARIQHRAEHLAESARSRLLDKQSATREELDLYEDAVLYLLYYRMIEPFGQIIGEGSSKQASKRVESYRQFAEDFDHFLAIPQFKRPPRYPVHHLFATYFQIRRAFHLIYEYIVGRSMPVAHLRGAVWQSVFTSDIQRYQRLLYNRMADFVTLIVGPSGTGKELVARAIGLSRYIPFDPRSLTFAEDFQGSFHPLNLSALSPTLIESELFGHRRGAFTGALEDRAGWLEICRPLGTVFLDEVGEIDGAIQVKLLRVLQTRTFQRLGDTQTRHFQGKIIAATNRDLAREMHGGRMRADFYYRLCSDMIVTPSLREILHDCPDDLHNMVMFIANRLTESAEENPSDPLEKGRSFAEAEDIAGQVEKWIGSHLGPDYAWPGNFRELEQCVRNVLIRGEYWPARVPPRSAREELVEGIYAGSLTADELLRRYCTLIQAQTHNYEETARRLGLDRRTVKAKVTPLPPEDPPQG